MHQRSLAPRGVGLTESDTTGPRASLGKRKMVCRARMGTHATGYRFDAKVRRQALEPIRSLRVIPVPRYPLFHFEVRQEV